MKFRIESVAIPFATLAMLIATGCAGPSAVYDKPQSRFDFPSSNVVPVGNVSGEATKVTLMFPALNDPDMEEEAVHQALAQKGADMLIDGSYYWKSFGYLIYWTKIEVEGQAAKVDLGLKKLDKNVPVGR